MFLEMQLGTLMVLLWASVIVLAAVIEAGTMDLSSIWFSVGAVFALIIALIWPEYIFVQAIVFVIVSIILLLVLRPIFKKNMRKNEIKTNADSLVGKIGQKLKFSVMFQRQVVFIYTGILLLTGHGGIILSERPGGNQQDR